MDFLVAPSASARRASSTSTERVLFAVNEHERATFFPDGFPEPAGVEVRWKPSGPPAPNDWPELLDDFQPTAIISCWSTPTIPAVFTIAGSPLRYVCHLVGSVRALVPRAFIERGGLLTNWGALAGDTVAEHALLLALAALRRQPRWQQIITGPRPVPWRNSTMRLHTRTLIGRRIGVHGFGHVARALVRLLQPFNVTLFAFSPGVPSSLMEAAGVSPCQSLVELAAHCDVFFECEALTPSNIACVNAAVLAALPDNAVFVNVARGLLVDEPALLREAQSGRIQIALDVVAREPLSPDSPPAALPDVLLSPHIAGPTHDRFSACGRLALDNLARYLRGEPPDALITPELYDRST